MPWPPGATIIPGWIKLDTPRGQGMLGYRLQGLRIGGAVGSHSILGDYCALSLFLMVYHFLHSRNIITKTIWLLITAMTFGALLATANRGAFISLMFGLVYSLWVFRRRMNLVRYVVAVTSFVALLGLAEGVLSRYTVAASLLDRLGHTEFEGAVPDSRHGVWEPVFQKSLEHIFIGHGPHYKLGAGLGKVFWPHNGYLFYLFTLGLFGLSCFLAIAYRLLRVSMRYSLPAVRDTSLGLLAAVLHVQLVIFLVGQMRTDHQRDNDYVYIYIVWMLFGLVAATGRIIRERIANHSTPGDPQTGVAATSP